ncbi:hypothetical protein ACIPSA_23435 [Streptomyces sp. NPDC086549]|uniref:hypothetical protein n=1 Tax=Streptomyces sp. NPDC086549 TaxID=3365752 RepID=UPI003815BFDF
MVRRTVWWRAGGHRSRRLFAAAARATAVGAVLCTTAALPGGSAVAAGAPGGDTYAFAEGDRTVAGAKSTTDAARLKPGETYRSSIAKGAELSYRLELDDATTTAYVPVTVVPPAGATVSATDGITVSVQDANGTACSYASARFGAGLSPRPVTALGLREAGKALCQKAGTYYLLVKRLDATGSATGSGGASSSGTWGLELAPVTEPQPAEAGPTNAPEAWNSASPEAVTGDPDRRAGGAGFATARALAPGVWQTDIEPGQTLFYKVPVDWGQQLYATAELGSSSGEHGYVNGALDLSLHNPVRGNVDDVARGYTGSQMEAVADPLPPVEYRNRYAVRDDVRAMRFAGSYYLVVHLSGQMADRFGKGPFGLTLRVRVSGTAHTGPAYGGTPEQHKLFEVTRQDREAAATGDAGSGDPTMKAVAVGGIGTGTALLLLLAVWTVVARRRAGTQIRVSAQKPTT